MISEKAIPAGRRNGGRASLINENAENLRTDVKSSQAPFSLLSLPFFPPIRQGSKYHPIIRVFWASQRQHP